MLPLMNSHAYSLLKEKSGKIEEISICLKAATIKEATKVLPNIFFEAKNRFNSNFKE